MGNRIEVSHMPALSLAEHHELDGLERNLRFKLNKCISPTGTDFNEPKAFEYMRSFAVEFFKLYIAAYSKYPDYRSHWVPASKHNAVLRVQMTFKSEFNPIHYLQSYELELFRTIEGYVKNQYKDSPNPILDDLAKQATEGEHSPLTGKQASLYDRAGIDLASASPLLLMVHAAQAQPEATSSVDVNPSPTRKALRDSYLAAHPTAKKLDMCWAAGQHYSEWKRWLRGVLKDGSAPDVAFRALLESGKAPHEYKKLHRPDGWK